MGPNMDYCKFENTVLAIKQCLRDLAEPEVETMDEYVAQMSDHERRAFELFRLALGLEEQDFGNLSAEAESRLDCFAHLIRE